MAFNILQSIKRPVCVTPFSYKATEHEAKLNWWWIQVFNHLWCCGTTPWFLWECLCVCIWHFTCKRTHICTQTCKWHDKLLRGCEGGHANVLSMQPTLFTEQRLVAVTCQETYQHTSERQSIMTLLADVNMVIKRFQNISKIRLANEGNVFNVHFMPWAYTFY